MSLSRCEGQGVLPVSVVAIAAIRVPMPAWFRWYLRRRRARAATGLCCCPADICTYPSLMSDATRRPSSPRPRPTASCSRRARSSWELQAHGRRRFATTFLATRRVASLRRSLYECPLHAARARVWPARVQAARTEQDGGALQAARVARPAAAQRAGDGVDGQRLGGGHDRRDLPTSDGGPTSPSSTRWSPCSTITSKSSLTSSSPPRARRDLTTVNYVLPYVATAASVRLRAVARAREPSRRRRTARRSRSARPRAAAAGGRRRPRASPAAPQLGVELGNLDLDAARGGGGVDGERARRLVGGAQPARLQRLDRDRERRLRGEEGGVVPQHLALREIELSWRCCGATAPSGFALGAA